MFNSRNEHRNAFARNSLVIMGRTAVTNTRGHSWLLGRSRTPNTDVTNVPVVVGGRAGGVDNMHNVKCCAAQFHPQAFTIIYRYIGRATWFGQCANMIAL